MASEVLFSRSSVSNSQPSPAPAGPGRRLPVAGRWRAGRTLPAPLAGRCRVGPPLPASTGPARRPSDGRRAGMPLRNAAMGRAAGGRRPWTVGRQRGTGGCRGRQVLPVGRRTARGDRLRPAAAGPGRPSTTWQAAPAWNARTAGGRSQGWLAPGGDRCAFSRGNERESSFLRRGARHLCPYSLDPPSKKKPPLAR